jgi:hypothetical protein
VYDLAMQLAGDPDGIAALKALVANHRDYLKFLITEARSSSDHRAAFRGADGTRWELVLRPAAGELEVRRAEPSST